MSLAYFPAPESGKDPRRAGRRDKVKAAMKSLRPLYLEAMRSDTEAAWAAFELEAAVLHRQSRLLAGKPRGG